MFQSLVANRTWHSVGLPLHAPSEYDGEPREEMLSEDLFAEMIDEAVSQLVPEGGVHLIGHSLGGFAALNYAAKFPARVISVVSVGGFMNGRADGLEGALQFLAAGKFFRRIAFHTVFRLMQRSRFVLKLAAVAYAKRRLTVWRSELVDATLREVFPEFQQHSITALRAFCRYLLKMNVLDEICSLQAPVLAIAGDRDPIIPFKHQQSYAERLVDGELSVFPGCGHLAFAEDEARFEKVVGSWLKRFDS